jgi:2,3-bisphosphoglycerate-independent phosphoglycerate mutase
VGVTGLMKRVLLVFVDGLGLGAPDDAVNPLARPETAGLRRLLAGEAHPIDACLGVAGAPQSATGQAALLTGVNAPRLLGRHCEGFPGPTLTALLQRENILRRVYAAGRQAAFANAYYADDRETVARRSLRSATTVSALTVPDGIRCRPMLERNRAVFHDVTRAGLRDRGYTGPLITPAEGAAHLAAIALQHDLTLFEYFETDRAGHRGRMDDALHTLGILDGLLGGLVREARGGAFLLLLTSDHGNIEDLGVRGHTHNPVPFLAVGPGRETVCARVTCLTDIAPAILAYLGCAV